jgi:hypothetical protein
VYCIPYKTVQILQYYCRKSLPQSLIRSLIINASLLLGMLTSAFMAKIRDNSKTGLVPSSRERKSHGLRKLR